MELRVAGVEGGIIMPDILTVIVLKAQSAHSPQMLASC